MLKLKKKIKKIKKKSDGSCWYASYYYLDKGIMSSADCKHYISESAYSNSNEEKTTTTYFYKLSLQ